MEPKTEAETSQSQDSKITRDIKDQVNISDDKAPQSIILLISDKIGDVNKLITNSILLLTFFIMMVIFYREWKNTPIIIEPYEVSKDVEKENYTGKMISNGIIAEIGNIYKMANTSMEHREIIGSWMGDREQFKLPGSDISISSLISYLKTRYGITEIHITGEAVKVSKGIQITTRLSGKQPIRVIATSTSMSTLYKTAAEYIIKNTQPYILAAYYYALDKKKCSELIDYILLQGPDDNIPPAYNLRGILLTDEHKYDEAIHSYQKATELDPKLAMAYSNWGSALDELGDVNGAIVKYEKAIELDPKGEAAYYNWGIALDEQGDVNGAIVKYQKATKLDPKDAAAYYNWGVALAKLGDVKGAIVKYEKAIELDPKDAAAYYNWGVALGKLGDLKGAIVKYQKAIELDPKLALAYIGWGNVLKKQGDIKDADVKFKKAKEVESE